MSALEAVQADRIARRALDLLPSIEAAADAGARFIRERTGTLRSLTWHSKAHADFVTDVDTGAERMIHDALLGQVPDARVLGEELSPDAAHDAATLFVVDPLDGTTNFLHGYPEYAVSIAAVLDGILAAGVVHNVVTGERFAATLGGGARRDGAPIRVSATADPARALIGTGFPFRTIDEVPAYLRQLEAVIRDTSGIRRAGSAALDLCDVACGRFEGFWELTLAPWDFAAGALIVREAGGRATTVTGEALPLAPSSVLAGNEPLHAWLKDRLGRAADG